MRVPSYDLLAPLFTTDNHVPGSGHAARDGERDYTIRAGGRTGTWIDTILTDGSTLHVSIRLEAGPNFRLVGQIRRKSSFSLIVTPAGAERYNSDVTLTRDLTDTTQLAGDLTALAPIVEGAFRAVTAASGAIIEADQLRTAATENKEAAEKLAKETKASAAIAFLASLHVPTRPVRAIDEAVRNGVYHLIDRERDCWVEVEGQRFFVEYRPGGNGAIADVIGLLRSPDSQAVMGTSADLYLGTRGRDAKGKQLTAPRAILVVEYSLSVTFGNSAEITDPALRNLASMMLMAHEMVDAKVVAALAAKAAAKAAAEQATRAAVAALPTIELATVVLPLADGNAVSRELSFIRLADGTWASDAVVAVRRGKSGEKVYAEAIHVGRAPALPSRITVGPRNLRPLFDLPPTILGWRHGPSGPTGPVVKITADPSLCDHNYVADPTAGLPAVHPRA